MSPKEYKELTNKLNKDIKILQKRINNLKATIQSMPKYERFVANQNLLTLESMLIDSKIQYSYFKKLSM